MRRLAKAWDDPQQRARILRWMWLLTTRFQVLGFAVKLYLLFVQK